MLLVAHEFPYSETINIFKINYIKLNELRPLNKSMNQSKILQMSLHVLVIFLT